MLLIRKSLSSSPQLVIILFYSTLQRKFFCMTQNHWVFGLRPSSGILETRKHNVSETASVPVLRWGGEKTPTHVGPLEKANQWFGLYTIVRTLQNLLLYESILEKLLLLNWQRNFHFNLPYFNCNHSFQRHFLLITPIIFFFYFFNLCQLRRLVLGFPLRRSVLEHVCVPYGGQNETGASLLPVFQSPLPNLIPRTVPRSLITKYPTVYILDTEMLR
jgi:hypothetical protein